MLAPLVVASLAWTTSDYWEWAIKVYRTHTCFDHPLGGSCVLCDQGAKRGEFKSSFQTESDNVWEPEQCVFVFAGSDDGGDWIENMEGAWTPVSVPKKDGGSTMVHGGYAASFLRLEAWVKARLDTGECGNCATYVGHSLGGAIATLFKVKYGGKAITFGAPPVFLGDQGCMADEDGKRFVHDADAATTAFWPSYWHGGGKAWLVTYDWLLYPTYTATSCQRGAYSSALTGFTYHCNYAWAASADGADDGHAACLANANDDGGEGGEGGEYNDDGGEGSEGGEYDDDGDNPEEDPCFPGTAMCTLANGTTLRVDALKVIRQPCSKPSDPAPHMLARSLRTSMPPPPFAPSLQEGDLIVAATADGTLTNDTVSLLSIAVPEIEVAFLTLTTSANKRLTLTAEHHLPVGTACCSTLKKAKEVVVGETVWAVESGATVARTVAKIETTKSKGLHSPVLTSGSFPVVDGIVTSFDSIEKVTLAKYGMASLLSACKATGTCTSLRNLFLNGADRKHMV